MAKASKGMNGSMRWGLWVFCMCDQDWLKAESISSNRSLDGAVFMPLLTQLLDLPKFSLDQNCSEYQDVVPEEQVRTMNLL